METDRVRIRTTLPVLSATVLMAFWPAGALGGPAAGASVHPSGSILAIGAENEYANVLSQIGGRYVDVSSILNNPNTDPHTFESSPTVAENVSAAQLIVQRSEERRVGK